jgi:hypothetical protein
MKLNDAKAFVGHQVHVCRFREAGTLLRWMGDDLRGKRVLDIAGGDGYWAGQARKRGAHAVSIDLARGKMLYGRTLKHTPALIECDALKLPFGDETLAGLVGDRGMELVDYSYQFRSRATERLYLSLSAYGGKVGFNAAAPLTPLVALADRRSPNERGSIVLIRARKKG